MVFLIGTAGTRLVSGRDSLVSSKLLLCALLVSCLKSTKRAGSLGDKVVEAAQTECAVQSEKGGHVTALFLWSCTAQQFKLALQDSVMAIHKI